MISYVEFIPDQAAEDSVRRALGTLHEVWTRQGRPYPLAPVILDALERPDPRVVYDHADQFCGEHFVMLYAAETDCVPLFRLRLEGIGDRSNLEFFLEVAARLGSPGVIRLLSQHGVQINARHDHASPNAETALHWAAYQGNVEAVEALLEHPEIEVDAKDRQGFTSLDLVVVRGYRQQYQAIADRLIAAGARLNPETVVQAAGMRNLLVLELLVRHVKDFNFTDPKKGISPLQAAVASGGVEEARRLIAAGADPLLPSRRKFNRESITYPRGSTARDFASLRGDADLIALFDS